MISSTRYESPNQIPGLSVWVDAADTSSFTTSSGTVTSLTDKASGTQYTLAGTPTWSSTAFPSPSGQNYPGFTMTAGRFIRALTSTFTTYQHTAFIVTKLLSDATGGNPCVALAQTTSGSTTFYRVLDSIPTTNFRTVALLSPAIVATSPTYSLNPLMASSDFNGVSTINARIFVNGAQTQVSQTGSATFATNTGAVMIGTDGGTGAQTNTWPGIVCEVLIYGNTVLSGEARQFVESYLLLKWGFQPFFSPLYYSLPTISFVPNLFNPTSIPNCQLWFDAADTGTITGSAPVVTWVNKGSIATNAVNSTGSFTSGNIYNGLNYIASPSGTEMTFTAALANQARTWFVVVRTSTTLTNSPQKNLGVINNSGASGQDSVVLTGDGTTFFPTLAIGPNTFGSYVAASVITPQNTVRMYSIVNSITVAVNIITEGGTSVPLTSNFAAANYSTNLLTYSINKASNNTQLDIFEIIQYGTDLTTAQRQQVEGYLAWKWGIQGNLPADHPYKFSSFLPTALPMAIPLGISFSP